MVEHTIEALGNINEDISYFCGYQCFDTPIKIWQWLRRGGVSTYKPMLMMGQLNFRSHLGKYQFFKKRFHQFTYNRRVVFRFIPSLLFENRRSICNFPVSRYTFIVHGFVWKEDWRLGNIIYHLDKNRRIHFIRSAWCILT